MTGGQISATVQHVATLAARQELREQPDQELLARFVEHRDEAAFAALMQRHGTMVLHVCRRVLHDAQEAEDACQAAFLVLMRQASSIRCQEAVGSWLHGVAWRIARKGLAKRSRRPACTDLPAEIADGKAGSEASWREVQEMLDEELDRLPAQYRAPLILCCLEGRTRDEAAQQLGWSLGTLRGRLDRGRERLRERLMRRGVTLSAALFGALLTAPEAAALPMPFIETDLTPRVLELASGFARTGTRASGFIMTVCVLGAALLVGLVLASFPGKLDEAAMTTSVSSLVSAPADEPEGPRLPLHVLLKSGMLDQKVTGPFVIASQVQKGNLEGLVAQGQPLGKRLEQLPKFLPPSQGEQTGLFFISPVVLNSGETWAPVKTCRQDNVITVEIESWQDNLGRDKNHPHRSLHLIPFDLSPGEYEVRYRWRAFRHEGGKQTYPLYGYESLTTGRYRFAVAKTGNPPPAVFPEEKPVTTPPPAAERDYLWQPPTSQQIQLDYFEWFQRGQPPVPMGLRAGAFDLKAWLATNPRFLQHLPNPQPPKGNDPLHAVVLGPELNTGEWMFLRAIEWQGRRAILHVEVWRDDGGRAKNIPYFPLIVSTLTPPDRKEPIQVEVQWTLLRAPNWGHPYAVEDVTKGEAATLMKKLMEKSKVELRLGQ